MEFLVYPRLKGTTTEEDPASALGGAGPTGEVREGQLVAHRRLPVPKEAKPNAGEDANLAPDSRNHPPHAGENVRTQIDAGMELFYATATGVLEWDGAQVAVLKQLRVSGDVDFGLGNLNFDGEIRVEGSVVQGFSVKAGSDITIAGDIEAGCAVTAAGNITVGRGIEGRRTQVTASGTVRVGFVREATVVAGGDIVLREYAHQARLRAGGRIEISGGDDRRGGSAVGGSLWTRAGIRAHTAGSPGHVQTLLMAGADPEDMRKLDELKKKADSSYNQFRALLEPFGMTRVDVLQIKNRIAAAVGPRRKLLAGKAKQLGQVAQLYKQLATACEELERKMTTQEQDAEIEIRDKAFPGVEIRLQSHALKLVEEIDSPCFRIADGRLVAEERA